MRRCALFFVLALSCSVAFGQTLPERLPLFAPTPGMLPTGREAALKIQSDATAAHRFATKDEIELAYRNAIQEEIKAIKGGHPERVSPEDRANCNANISYEAESKARSERESALAQERAEKENMEAARNEEDRKNKIEMLKKYHCPTAVRVGSREKCVYLLLGHPDHTNVDALSGKQLVYPNDYYVYVSLNGVVEDIQSTY
jgi:hypothetical protein